MNVYTIMFTLLKLAFSMVNVIWSMWERNSNDCDNTTKLTITCNLQQLLGQRLTNNQFPWWIFKYHTTVVEMRHDTHQSINAMNIPTLSTKFNVIEHDPDIGTVIVIWLANINSMWWACNDYHDTLQAAHAHILVPVTQMYLICMVCMVRYIVGITWIWFNVATTHRNTRSSQSYPMTLGYIAAEYPAYSSAPVILAC